MKNLGLILILVKLFGKVGPILLKLVKIAKFAKAGLAVGSLAAYSYMFTWQFALVLLFAIIVHEYGHLNAMKKCGIPTKGIYLIPFFGGAAVSSESIKSYHKEAYVSLMGPVYGFFSMIPFFLLYLYDKNPLWIGLVSFIAMINLFNLLPINPLDGGRIVKSITFSLHSTLGYIMVGLGFLLGIVLVYKIGSFLLGFVMIIGLLEMYGNYVEYKEHGQTFEFMSKKDVIIYSLFYIISISIFIYIIYECGTIEGADLALKIIKDQDLE